MKRLLLLISACLICVLACQKKQKDTPEPEPEEINVTPLTDSAFIQYIEVAGAEKIVFDSTLDAYQITLQAGYTANEVGIQFKLYPAPTSTGAIRIRRLSRILHSKTNLRYVSKSLALPDKPKPTNFM